MNSYIMEEPATEKNFDEAAYLRANPDVSQAVRKGEEESGRSHFQAFGRHENRMLRYAHSNFLEAKANKLRSIASLLRSDMSHRKESDCYDFLTPELRNKFNIVDTEAVSSHEYDTYAMEIVNKHKSGWILDCGAGKRPVYFENVVNFEIVSYDTTDVRGVGEVLPFTDNAFDAVLSIAVLEHVKDPFLCAREIARVLKPGGDLMCCVPFLQPLHGYPHHYYNMTQQGLKNLFENLMEIDRFDVYDSILPIASLIWIVRSWAEGLEGQAKQEFLDLTMADLMESYDKYLDKPFVKNLSREKNFELASGTVLFARKKIDA